MQIIAYCCHYCAYAAADLAGSMRLSYPTDVKVVELPCSGKIDILQVLHAFEHGVDGVMVAGWLEGDCHYLEGNVNARRRVDRIRHLLDQIGLDGQRVAMVNVSSAMGVQFADTAVEMAERIEELGPNPLRMYVSEERTDQTQ